MGSELFTPGHDFFSPKSTLREYDSRRCRAGRSEEVMIAGKAMATLTGTPGSSLISIADSSWWPVIDETRGIYLSFNHDRRSARQMVA
jgi:hypothetical protein